MKKTLISVLVIILTWACVGVIADTYKYNPLLKYGLDLTGTGSSGTTYTNSDGLLSIVGSVIDVTTNALLTTSGTNTPDGSFDFSGASSTVPVKTASADPGTCSASPPMFYFNTTTLEYKYCISSNTWVSLHYKGSSVNPAYHETAPGVRSVSGIGAAGTIGWIRQCTTTPITVAKIAVYFHATGAAGTKFSLGVYYKDKTLAVQSGAIAGDSGAVSIKSASVGPVYLPADCYFFAWAANDNSIQINGSSRDYLDGGGYPSVASVPTYGTSNATWSNTTGLPANLNTLSAISFGNPLVVPNFYVGP